LLPVKTILREYLNDTDGAEDEDEDGKDDIADTEVMVATEPEVKEPEVKEPEVKAEVKDEVKPEVKEEVKEEVKVDSTTQSIQGPKSSMKSTVTVNKEAGAVAIPEVVASSPQTLVVDTEPTVSFTNMDTIFDSNDLEGNEIAAHSMFEDGEVDKIEMLNLPPEEIDGFEDLDSGSAIEFEEINA
jgi:hypothetical protein